MPIYEYKCHSCNEIFEIKQGINDEPLKYCPSEECQKRTNGKSEISRVISKNIGFVFNGSGFYLTDYAKKDSSAPAESSNSHHTHGANCSCNSVA